MCRHVKRSSVTCYKYSITCQDDIWQSIMRKVTWRRFDQSAKQLVVGQTTIVDGHYNRRTARRVMSVKIFSAVETSCRQQQIHATNRSDIVRGYRWSTCCKQPRFDDCHICRQQTRPSTATTMKSFVDIAINLPWQSPRGKCRDF